MLGDIGAEQSVVIIECGTGGGGDPTSGSGSMNDDLFFNTDSTTNGWGSSNSNNPPRVYTGPIPVAIEVDTVAESNKLFERFKYYLDAEKKDYLIQNGAISNQLKDFLYSNKYTEETIAFVKQLIQLKINGIDDDKVCLGSFEFSDVGNSNWQNAGMSDVNVQFLTIGNIIEFVNTHFPELHFGLPK